jgi:ketosteroid isomerase-like protein
MSEYVPDAWVIVKITPREEGEDAIFKVLGGWSGGYLQGDSWRMNSGITKVEDGGDVWLVHGHSGSVYKLRKGGERVTMIMGGVLAQLGDAAAIVDISEVPS